MRTTIDTVVIACMFMALYINWTDFPKQPQVIRGTLLKIGVEE